MSAREPLQQEFDGAFAREPQVADAAPLSFLTVRVSGEPLAIPVPQLKGLVKARRIVRIPDAAEGVLGLTGLRGRLLTIFSLAARLGQPADAHEPWILLAGDDEPIGLAVAELEGHVRAAPEDVLAPPPGAGPRPHVRDYLRAAGLLRGILDVRALVNDIQTRAGAQRLDKEP